MSLGVGVESLLMTATPLRDQGMILKPTGKTRVLEIDGFSNV